MSPSIDSFTTFSEVTLQNDYRTLSFTPTSRIIAQTRETPRKSEQIAKKQKVNETPPISHSGQRTMSGVFHKNFG